MVAIVFSGCLNLEPTENPTRYYVLGGDWEESEPASVGLSVGLRRLELAEYLESSKIVVREAPHEVRFMEYHRWAEDLNRSINRAVAGYLWSQPLVRHVDVVPWSSQVQHDYHIQLQVVRFEGVSPDDSDAVAGDVGVGNGVAHLLIIWEILDPLTGDALASGTSEYREDGWDGNDFYDLARMLDAGLRALSSEIMDRLATFGTR